MKNSKARAEKRTPTSTKAVFTYVSQCCNTPATKPPLVAPKVDTSKKVNGLAPMEDCGGLGKFRCSNCKKRCKVTPHRNQEGK